MSAFPGFKSFGNNTNPQGGQPSMSWSAGGGTGQATGGYSKSAQTAQQYSTTGPKFNGYAGGLGALGGLQKFASSQPKPPKPGMTIGNVKGTMPGAAFSQNGYSNPWAQIEKNQMAAQQNYMPNGSMQDVMAGALMQDAKTAEQSRQFDWGRREGARGDMMGNLGDSIDRIRQSGGDAGAGMDDAASRIRGVGDDARGMFDLVKGRIDTAESEYKDMTAENMSTNAYAMTAANQSSMQQAFDSLEGQGLSESEKMAMRTQMQGDLSQRIQASNSQLLNSFNENMAQYRQGNTGILAEMGNATTGARLSAEQQAAGLISQGHQFRQSAEALAAQMRLQGDMAGYEMMTSNPWSPVSIASVIGSMMEMFDSGAGAYANPYDFSQMGGFG